MVMSLRMGVHYFFGVLLIAATFIINPFNLSTTYGNGNGKWADPVDSFSEYLVRNKIINDQIGFENKHSFLIITKDYANENYRWQPTGTSLYYSQYALHARALTYIAAILGLKNVHSLETFFTLTRAMNALLVAVILTVYWARYFFHQSVYAYWLAIILTALSSGLVLFASNLYFALGIFLLPFGIVACLYGQCKFNLLCLIVAGLAAVNFLCRFEFATVFSLVTLLPAFVFSKGKPLAERVRDTFFIFLATVAGFVIAVLWHGFSVSILFQQPLNNGFQMAFGSIRHRTLSWDNVPYPFSWQALKTWNHRLNDSCFYFFGLTINKRAILLIFLSWVPWHVWRGDKENLIISLWGFGCYVSWYIFAYQHIMLHVMYDWLIFSLSIGTVIIMQTCQLACNRRFGASNSVDK